MEMEYFFTDGVLLVALTALVASFGPVVGRLIRAAFPSAFRMAARFERRHPGLFESNDNFYCFFRKATLYGK